MLKASLNRICVLLCFVTGAVAVQIDEQQINELQRQLAEARAENAKTRAENEGLRAVWFYVLFTQLTD